MTSKRRHYGRKPSTELGVCLKEWREKAHLTLEEAALKLGLQCKNPAAYLSQIERGHKPIPDAILSNVARLYHVPPDEVLGKAYWPQLILLPLIAIIEPEQLSRDLIEELEKGLKEEERQELTHRIEEILHRRQTVGQHSVGK